MNSCRIPAAIGAGLITFGLSPALAFGAMLYMPISDGTTWTFEVTSQWSDSTGGSGSYGPSVEQIRFVSGNYPIFGQTATIAGVEGGGSPTGGSGFFMTETASGYFVVADGNPNTNQWYEYYNDPSPFMTNDDLTQGQSVNYSGLWSGQWDAPRGGYQAWTGTWETTITNLGVEEVTTPLGTFQAVKFRDITTSTRSPNPDHLALSTMTGYSWLVEGFGMVKSTESWFDESDFNGDGVQDWWARKDLTRYALSYSEVPIPAAIWLFGAGLVGLLGTANYRGSRKHWFADAM